MKLEKGGSEQLNDVGDDGDDQIALVSYFVVWWLMNEWMNE